MVPLSAYRVGIDQAEVEGRTFLIATPEKALCDKIYSDRGSGVHSQREMESYLSINLRIGLESLENPAPDVV
jgi:hypothetical protein